MISSDQLDFLPNGVSQSGKKRQLFSKINCPNVVQILVEKNPNLTLHM